MKRDVGLKPRETGNLPPEKLREILGRIYPEEVADELMERFADESQPPKRE